MEPISSLEDAIAFLERIQNESLLVAHDDNIEQQTKLDEQLQGVVDLLINYDNLLGEIRERFERIV
jgi:hypothetical protein